MADEWVEEEVIETTWKCKACQTENRGLALACSSCGKAHEEKETYIVDPNLPKTTDPEVERVGHLGANRPCPYCGADGRADQKKCLACGASLSSDRDNDAFDRAGVQPTHDRPATGTVPPPESIREPKYRAPTPRQRPSPKKPDAFLTKVLFFVALGVALISVVLWPKEYTATVTGQQWTRTLEVETRVLRNGDAWRSNVPSDAFNISCHTMIERVDHIVDHYQAVPHLDSEKYDTGQRTKECTAPTITNNKNGTATRRRTCKEVKVYATRSVWKMTREPVYRAEPIYRDRCTYDVYGWSLPRAIQRTGTGTSAAWPVVDLGPGERVRVGGQLESNEVTVHAENNVDYRLSLPYDKFVLLIPGRGIRIKVFLGSASLVDLE